MRRLKNLARGRRAIFPVALAGAMACTMVGPATAGVADYNNASLYPKRVTAMQFQNPLDATHTVGWADWDVDFAKDLPTAAWGTGTGYTTITIGHLLCHNAAGDSHFCDFEIQYFESGGAPNCSVFSADDSYAVNLNSVNCPDSIEFEQ